MIAATSAEYSQQSHDYQSWLQSIWVIQVQTCLGGVRYLSVRAYTLAILHGMDDTTFEPLGDRVIEFQAAVVGAIVVTVVFFLLTVRRLRRMDVP